MMELSKQVVSLPLAQKMKEMGFGQEGLFVWVPPFPFFNEETRLTSKIDFESKLTTSSLSNEARDIVKTYSDYTIAELGKILPDGYFAYKHGSSWFTKKDLHQIAIAVTSNTETNAKATLAIYLKENNLL